MSTWLPGPESEAAPQYICVWGVASHQLLWRLTLLPPPCRSQPAVLSHDELLCDAARLDCSREMARWLLPELLQMVESERAGRETAAAAGTLRSRRLLSKVGLLEGDEDYTECCVCHYFCHLGGLVCECDRTRTACFLHRCVALGIAPS